MKKQALFFVSAIAILFASCGKTSVVDPNPVDPGNGIQVAVKADITTSTTWTADKIYTLSSIIYVTNGATLTIEPGTIIKGAKSVSGAGSLVITRGSKIMAVGTADKPIVFTSAQPVGQRAAQDWGGVILLGKAPVNQGNDNQIEGISAGNANALYGGTDAADNSGTMKYVRIEFGGVPLSPDNEINGLTFGGVGSGTTIDYIEVYRSGDDSYEWFGGTVNAKHLMAIGGLDDDFDTDFGFSGKLQFCVGQRYPTIADVSGSNGFESDNDGDGSNKTPKTSAIFSNMTMVGPYAGGSGVKNVNANYQHAAQIRRNSALSTFNSVFVGYVDGIYIDDSKVATAGATSTNYTLGLLTFSNNIVGYVKNTSNAVKGENKALFEIQLRAANMFDNTLVGSTLFTAPTKIASGFADAGTPNFLPIAGSLAASGALFTDAKIANDPFFEKVTYRGAFGTTDWTSGWASFDPQLLAYDVPGKVK
ncbi:putative membrane protein [Pedobacter sp. UYEF25]